MTHSRRKSRKFGDSERRTRRILSEPLTRPQAWVLSRSTTVSLVANRNQWIVALAVETVILLIQLTCQTQLYLGRASERSFTRYKMIIFSSTHALKRKRESFLISLSTVPIPSYPLAARLIRSIKLNIAISLGNIVLSGSASDSNMWAPPSHTGFCTKIRGPQKRTKN